MEVLDGTILAGARPTFLEPCIEGIGNSPGDTKLHRSENGCRRRWANVGVAHYAVLNTRESQRTRPNQLLRGSNRREFHFLNDLK